MAEDSVVPASLEYRKNRTSIWEGRVPGKYTRIVPYVSGSKVLEIGAAEGVLSLLLAERGKTVLAVEKRDVRHAEALKLKERWRALGRKVNSCQMLFADVQTIEPLMAGMDCLLAVRVMYHLREYAPTVIQQAYKAGITSVVLCGNKNRASRFEAGNPHEGLGWFNYYSTVKGMSELLTKAGYKIERVVSEGDPIVVGTHRPNIPT